MHFLVDEQNSVSFSVSVGILVGVADFCGVCASNRRLEREENHRWLFLRVCGDGWSYSVSGGVVNFDIWYCSAERGSEIFIDLKRVWSICGEFSSDDVGAVLVRQRINSDHEGDCSGKFCAVSFCVELLHAVKVQNVGLVVVVDVSSERGFSTHEYTGYCGIALR